MPFTFTAERLVDGGMSRAAEESSPLGACLVIGASGMIGRRLVAQLWQTVEVHGISITVSSLTLSLTYTRSAVWC